MAANQYSEVENRHYDPDTAGAEDDAVLKLLIEEARDDIVAFLHFMWPQVEGQSYIIGALHEELARVAQETFEGKRGPNQVVSVPPQHGKSRMLSVRVVAWLIGKKPGIHIALTGYSGSLLTDFVDEARQIMETPRYRMVFGDIAARRGRNRAHDVLFSNGSNIQARSCGSKLTGRRVDWLVIDDPHSGREEAESPTQRRKVKRWFFADCLSRISSKACIFVVATRWHPDDLIGNLTHPEIVQELEDAGFKNLVFQTTNYTAIAEHGDPLGREPGEALFPEQRPIDFLMGVKALQPAYEWESQYMGRPKTASGDQIDTANIKRIELSEVPEGLEWGRGWDLAITEDQKADYTAGAKAAIRYETVERIVFDEATKTMKLKPVKLKHFYLIHMRKGQKAWAAMRAMIIEQARRDKEHDGVSRIAIESVSGFEAVYQDVKQDLLGDVKVVKKNPPRGGKLLRAQNWLNLIEAGRFYMVRGPWNKDFINELALFPDGPHDDQVDAVSIVDELLSTKDKLLIA
jgi:predicted phage terminase large subunit-like protein